MKLSDYAPSAARHVIVYGAPKTGKTELVAALSKFYKLWWFDLDGGIKTLLQAGKADKFNLDNIEYFRIPDSQNFPVAVSTMLKVFKGLKGTVCHEHGMWDCPACKKDDKPTTPICLREFTSNDILVVDSFSQLMESTINFIMKDALAKDDFDAKSDWDDWRKQGSISDRFGSTIQNAAYNVIVTSHEILVPMQDGSKKIVPIGGTRNQSSDFAKFFDDVVYTEIINGKYQAHSMPTATMSKIVVGSRTGKRLITDKGEQLGLIELFK